MYKWIITIFAMALLAGCSKENPVEPKNENTEIFTFKSVNVKTQGKQYFTFSNNTGTTIQPPTYDIAFGVVPLTVETAPCQFFTMPNDPVILCGPGVSMAKVEAASLNDVNAVPQADAFRTDNRLGSTFIGKIWLDAQYQIKPDVYVIKTCAGNYGLLDIKRYEMDFNTFQIQNIVWEFKYNDNGSADFTNTAVDSFATGNAYTEIRYFSFADGAVTANDPYDLKVEGSSIWLGNKVQAKKLENTTLADITVVTQDNFETDVKPFYVTRGWYNYDEGHTLTPKDYVYVVKTADGKYRTFEITNYYDDQGNSGTFTIEWK